MTVTRATVDAQAVSFAADKTSTVFKEEGITYTLTRSGWTTAALSPCRLTLTPTKEFLSDGGSHTDRDDTC